MTLRHLVFVLAGLGIAGAAWAAAPADPTQPAAAPAGHPPTPPTTPSVSPTDAAKPSAPAPATTKAADPATPDPKSAQAKPATTTPAAKPPLLSAPITFFVAHGDPDACGAGCSEWIAADGAIDPGSDARLSVLLKRLGGRKLPVFFHSPGGSVGAALAIGRLLRSHGMMAGVARTIPTGCDPKPTLDEACEKLERSGGDLPAKLDTAHWECNSSCVWALVGAAVREVGAGVQIGIHTWSTAVKLQRIDAAGHLAVVPSHTSSEQTSASMAMGAARLALYARAMGISPALVGAARAVSFDHLRYLTRDDLASFGIDRRESVESGWLPSDQPRPSLFKIIDAKDAEGRYRRTFIRLTCLSAASLWLQYVREGTSDPSDIRLRATTGGTNIMFGRGTPLPVTTDRPAMLLYGAALPSASLKDSGFAIEPQPRPMPSADPSAAQTAASSTTSSVPGSVASSAGAAPARIVVPASGAVFDLLVERCKGNSQKPNLPAAVGHI